MRRFELMGRLLVVAVSLAWPEPSFARRVDNWPFDRLVRESDLVVIAEAVATADAGESTTLNGWQVKFKGVVTTFKVEAVLKGKLAGDGLKVLHFQAPKGVRIQNGPGLVTFLTKNTSVTLTIKEVGGKKAGTMVEWAGRPSYLLFLRKAKDGRFEPVSGRVDPAESVQELSRPGLRSLAQDESD